MGGGMPRERRNRPKNAEIILFDIYPNLGKILVNSTSKLCQEEIAYPGPGGFALPIYLAEWEIIREKCS